MFFLVLGFLLTATGLALLSFFTDWRGAERDAYFRNAGAGGGFLAFLGLLTIYLGAQSDALMAVRALALAVIAGTAGAWFLRQRNRGGRRAIVVREEDLPPPK